MSDLVTFLRARLDEDEAAARAALAPGAYAPHLEDGAAAEVLEIAESEGCDHRAVAHFARHDPARVLAEVAAKRAIVGVVEREVRHRGLLLDGGLLATSTCPLNPRCACDRCIVARSLVLPYAGHPDYREEWRP